ncbi:unnamed protein product [Anisakis simplex]|uniref:G_PROTEIN_RECEP_F1_2 domain-containing protein n=1 Tax=Anisakis simplex TaxID=6269 RepID=A0A0M3KBZ0_ANISI|nr:unnamed protein product [Anisakis simplex]
MEPPKDTLVRLSEYDEERSPTNSCCCGAIHIRHGAIVIALLSLFSSTVNGILICLGISRTALNFFVEVGMLVADLVAIVALFYGVIYRRPAFLKPYLLVNQNNSINQLISVATLATITMISGLLVTIVINFWFLYVVFLCFQWMNAYVVKINDSTRPTPDDDPFTVKAITNNTDISASTQNHTETKSKDNDRMFDLNSTSNGIIL